MATTQPGRPALLDEALGRGGPIIVFDNVWLAFDDKVILRDVSFTLQTAHTKIFLGASGAGKSTIAQLLLRFHDPDRGSVSLDGHDLRDVTLESVRENVGIVLQDTLVFDRTVRDTIAYGRPGASENDIVAAARAADAHEFITMLPDGYDAVVGQKGRRLSGGQLQRLAIARALLRDAPVLVLDEPWTGLDAESAQRLLEPLRRLMDGRTTVVISHSLVAVRGATEILVLERGRVVERGSHDELVALGGGYARRVDRAVAREQEALAA